MFHANWKQRVQSLYEAFRARLLELMYSFWCILTLQGAGCLTLEKRGRDQKIKRQTEEAEGNEHAKRLEDSKGLLLRRWTKRYMCDQREDDTL